MQIRTWRAGCALALAALSACALAQPVQSIRGDVVAVDAEVLRIRTAAGEERAFALPADARIGVRAPASLADVVQGAFVGATASPRADGTLVASEVHIFPEAMRGTGEGHRPMTSRPGSTMTNATVSRVTRAPGTSTTNATVARIDAAGTAGEMLHLTYQGGAQDILVPDGVPVVTLEEGARVSLTPGAHVIVHATTGDDGRLTAARVSVGKNGSVPPI